MNLDSNTPFAPPKIATLEADPISAWIKQIHEAVRDSDWAPFLSADGIDLFDVLYTEVRLTLLKLSRDPDPKLLNVSQPLLRRIRQSAQMTAYRAKWRWNEWRASARSEPPRSAKIVFWPRVHNHAISHFAVRKALETRGISSQIVVCNAALFDDLCRHGISSLFLRTLWSREITAARRRGRLAARELQRARPPVLPSSTFPHAAEWIAPIMRSTIARGLPGAHEAVVNASQLLSRFRPEVLVVGYDLTHEGRAGCLVAQREGIPTACLMHGSVFGTEANQSRIADRILVYGESSRRELLKSGLAPERIVVCGAPHLDQRPQQSGKIHPALQTHWGIREGAPWILAATSGPGHSTSHEHHRIVIESLTRLSLRFPEIPIVVKLHPKDRMEFYEGAIRRNAPPNFHVVSHGQAGFPTSIFDWLQGCPLMVTGASTAAIDAMLVEVPVISMDFASELKNVDFIDFGATTHVRDFEELAERAEVLLRNPHAAARAREKAALFLRDAFFALDGHSAERAADELMRIASRSDVTEGPRSMGGTAS